ncbi:MAG: thiamine pyrophosphate-binding protein [Clostridiales bacterium]|nr:thiamine pyrophosphate-binding protein [Clostridiales bacterium]
MKASDYIADYLVNKEITDVFGYPGGMVTHLMDSLSKYPINSHVTYHEQGAAFAACGYAQESGKVGVAYATSGPGATNLITGICDAYFDSIPTLFITGQVNTFESKGELGVRQRGFQETDIVAIVTPVTKFAAKIEDASKLRWYLDYAFYIASEGRKGPVLLDIPMNIMRSDIDPDTLQGFTAPIYDRGASFDALLRLISQSSRPVILAGSGVKASGASKLLNEVAHKLNIPVVTTMLAVDAPEDSYGFIGAYGSRTANFIVAKSDLVISLGARLDVRQTGADRGNFAPDARIVRVDIDKGELEYKVHPDEIDIHADVKDVLEVLLEAKVQELSGWNAVCRRIRSELEHIDDSLPNRLIKRISEIIPPDSVITTDVGQNQVWIAQSFKVKSGQRIFFSGGHGAMGYSLPASIGCAVSLKDTVYSFSGDGGIQMNIQELQTIAREKLPVKIILLNNSALGMIRHFQEMYFENNYVQTVPDGGYTVPDFGEISRAYKIPYTLVQSIEDIRDDLFSPDGPQFIEVRIDEPTYVFPKLEFGKPNQDQEPLLDRELYDKLMKFDETDIEDM